MTCNACLRLASKRGLNLGDQVVLRGGHTGTITDISHNAKGITALVHSDDGREALLLPLTAIQRQNPASQVGGE